MELNSLRYIRKDYNGLLVFDDYFKYLKSIYNLMPDGLYQFSSNPARYDLSTSDTLHDAWVKSFLLEKTYPDGNLSIANVSLELLSPCWKKIYKLSYGNVKSFDFYNQPDKWLDRATDLIVHEVGLEDSGDFYHQFIFDRGVNLNIKFCQFEFSERFLNP
jgi:hypothetical protein